MLNKNFIISSLLILTIIVSGCAAKKKEPKPEEFLTLADLSGRVTLKEDSPDVRVIRIKSKAFIKRNDVRAAKAKALEIAVHRLLTRWYANYYLMKITTTILKK